MTTTDAHADALGNCQRTRFEDEVLAHLRNACLMECVQMSDDELRELIRTGIEKAGAYSILRERDVARYIELMLVVSPSFDEEEWAHDILSANWIPAHEKIERLNEEVEQPETEAPTSSPDSLLGSPVLTPAAPAGAKLTVNIVDADKGPPIEGAKVFVTGPEFRDAISDSSGSATFSGLSPGDYRVLVNDAKKMTGNAEVTVTQQGGRVTVTCKKVVA